LQSFGFSFCFSLAGVFVIVVRHENLTLFVSTIKAQLGNYFQNFLTRKFVGETHFFGRPGRELIDAAAFAASLRLIKIACPDRSPMIPAARMARQSVLACSPRRRAWAEMDALFTVYTNPF
jgi:hypothetical protein